VTRLQVKNQKIRAIKLLLSYAIATKHHLRGEYETDYEDFIDVLPDNLFGKRRNTLADTCQAWSAATSAVLSRPRRGEASPLLGDPKSLNYHSYEDEKKYAFPLM
jgi:putative membrane protein